MASFAIATPATLSAEPPGDLASALGELRKGGLVIYIRHGSTNQGGKSDEDLDLLDCATQRELSAGGRSQAEEIGKAIRELGIPVGTVTTSPFCRTKDTGRLAFGRFTISNDLHSVSRATAEETRRASESLRTMLATPPAISTNAFIISHSSNLREATGLWPKPEGVAYVFRPSPQGLFEVIARVAPKDWGRVAKLDAARKPR